MEKLLPKSGDCPSLVLIMYSLLFPCAAQGQGPSTWPEAWGHVAATLLSNVEAIGGDGWGPGERSHCTLNPPIHQVNNGKHAQVIL